MNFVSLQATKKACDLLLARLTPIKAENPGADWAQVIAKAFEKNVDLAATYMYKPSDLKEYQVWGASCCEVEVDFLTGNLQITRVDILEDVGESLSPGIDIGQIEGAFVMGLGYWLTENLVYDRSSGELLTNRTWNYKPPGAKDIPVDFRVTFLRRSSNPFGVLRSKSKYLECATLLLSHYSHFLLFAQRLVSLRFACQLSSFLPCDTLWMLHERNLALKAMTTSSTSAHRRHRRQFFKQRIINWINIC